MVTPPLAITSPNAAMTSGFSSLRKNGMLWAVNFDFRPAKMARSNPPVSLLPPSPQ